MKQKQITKKKNILKSISRTSVSFKYQKRKRLLQIKHKPFEANLNQSHYYLADSVPFAHEPPGHTCGLPCCNRDLHIHLKLSGYGGCMSMPFQPKPQKQDNFSFRQKRAGLINGRPTFTNKFSSLQPERKSQRRKPLPVFGSLRESGFPAGQLHELSRNQQHYLKERGITLPRMHTSESSDYARNRIPNDSDISEESSDSETDYYTIWECNGMDSEIQIKSPNALKSTEKIYPWTLLENVQQKPEEDDIGVSRDHAMPTSFKYGSLPMCYKEVANAETNGNNQDPVKQSETKFFTLNFDKNKFDNKRFTLERTNITATNSQQNNTSEATGERFRSSTLPRSSIRIRPILKNRIENIYTDLITPRGQIHRTESPEDTEDHEYEKIRDVDIIQKWHPENKNKIGTQKKTASFVTFGKKLPGLETVKKFHAYENSAFKTEEGLNRKTMNEAVCKTADDKGEPITDKIPITLIL